MDENECECQIFPEVMQLAFWFMVSATSAALNGMAVSRKFYDSLSRFRVPLEFWLYLFAAWYAVLPFVVYYGIQKPECGVGWRLIVYAVFIAVFSCVGIVFFRLMNLIFNMIYLGVVSGLGLSVTVVFSTAAEWWPGFVFGMMTASICAFYLFVIHLSTNPANEYVIERLRNQKYELENIDKEFQI